MSGNPFRASLSQHPTAAAAAPGPTGSLLNADSSSSDETARELDTGNASSPPPARTKKSVRIESPTSSDPHPAFHDADDALAHRIDREKHASAPPLASPAAFSDNFEDIDTTDLVKTDDSGDGTHGAQHMTGSKWKSSEMAGAAQFPASAPANPFARTLATIEPQEKGRADRAHGAGQSRERTGAEKPVPAPPKANLDVEGFKRLLMTGISSPSSSGQPSQSAAAPNPSAPSIFESSSSTDTSSVSRQSIFEPVPEPHMETPRTSYEMAPSDEETVGLVTEVKKTGKKKPPPAPKHRHGKLVSSRTPQTVSFSEFSATEASFTPTVTRNRDNSDLNKPLPPTPPVVSPPPHIISQDASQDEPPPLETKASESSSLSDVSLAQRKVPPPVPLARRQSQLRTSSASNRSRSNSNLTMSSQHSTEFPLVSPGATSEPKPPTSQKAAPPPPPARRHGASLIGGNASSANSSTTELSTTLPARRTTLSSPDPPSSRRTTFSSSPPSPAPGHSSLARTSSLRSTRNTPRSVSNESATMPPPPPPPRRRQSARTSIDKERPLPPSSSPTESRRTSLENKRSSIDGKRRTSVASESSLRYEYAPGSESEHALYSPKEEADRPRNVEPQTIAQSNPTDILDDMEKFQREIDELRERYRR